MAKSLGRKGLLESDRYRRIMKFSDYIKENNTQIENHIRDHLSGTARKVTQRTMWSFVKDNIKGSKEKDFVKVWKSLVKDNFLVKTGKDVYKWEL